jgi:beta-galactosidase
MSKFHLTSMMFLCFSVGHLPAADGVVARERLSFDPGWQFHLGDIPFPEIKGHDATYGHAKAGNASGAAALGFDDTAWRTLDLPHDWAVEGPFDQNANLSQGYRPRGTAWYRKRFSIPNADRGKHLELEFDGIATNATVWLNGTVVQRNWCGYTGFTIDLTPFARFGGNADNIVAVRVDAEEQEGWWYEGAGIYRHAWLTKRAPTHITTDGVFAQPVRDAAGKWTIPVEVTCANSGKVTTDATIESVVIDSDGKELQRGSAIASVASCGEAVARYTLAVNAPRLWSVDTPTLYRVRTSMKATDGSTDTVETTCGFRTLRFDADKGFFLNEHPLKIKGTCNHQDHAGVGVALPDSLWEYRVRRLKELGSNAYRAAHNPPSREFLAECDRQGLLVMDENRNFNCSPEYVRQLEWMVRRDRNHPSVILWSVFNEEPMQGSEQGYEMVRRMAAVVKHLDTSRPVTAAMNGGLFTALNVSKAVDVVGFNYQQNSYDRFHKENPTLPLTSSEDTSAFMTRGEWTTDKKKNRIGSYDDQRAPWGATHRTAWKAIATRPYLAGGFVWTGFDYRGEPTPHQWPSAGSFFGIMDLCGFPKAAYYLHQAQWIDDTPILKVMPHWNWAGQEGKEIKVMVCSNAERVALFLNGNPQGEQVADRFDMNTWKVKYAPGRLEAVAYRGGTEIARDAIETTDEPAALRLIPDRTALKGDGWDALPITVEVIDARGRVVPTAGPMVQFAVDGGATIIGLGNGDPNCHEAEKGDRHSLFYGLGQIILQSAPGATGTVRLIATAEGLKAAHAGLTLTTTPIPASVSGDRPAQNISKWRISPATTERPDPNQKLADNDQNSWQPIDAGKIQTFAGGTWAVMRASFTPFAAQQTAGGVLMFSRIVGKAEVWIDGKKVAEKTMVDPGELSAPFPAGTGTRTVNLMIEAAAGTQAGLAGRVSVEAVR